VKATKVVCECDVCGTQAAPEQAAAFNWKSMDRIGGAATSPYFSSFSLNAEQHVCSDECAIKVFSQWLTEVSK
jgi:hypothetical protein